MDRPITTTDSRRWGWFPERHTREALPIESEGVSYPIGPEGVSYRRPDRTRRIIPTIRSSPCCTVDPIESVSYRRPDRARRSIVPPTRVHTQSSSPLYPVGNYPPYSFSYISKRFRRYRFLVSVPLNSLSSNKESQHLRSLGSTPHPSQPKRIPGGGPERLPTEE